MSQSAPVEFNVPFNGHQSQKQVPHFTGRSSIMLELHGALTKDCSRASSSPIILFGPGGFGKTQIALEYISIHRKDYRSMIWIDGASPESARRSFRDFAFHLLNHYDANSLNSTPIYRRLARLALEEDERDRTETNAESRTMKSYDDRLFTAVEIVLDWLRMAQNKDWLLVYDNYDDIESYDVRDFFPGTQCGSIIVTSRRPDCARLGFGIRVELLSQVDALELLQKSAHLTGKLDNQGKVSYIGSRYVLIPEKKVWQPRNSWSISETCR